MIEDIAWDAYNSTQSELLASIEAALRKYGDEREAAERARCAALARTLAGRCIPGTPGSAMVRGLLEGLARNIEEGREP